MFLMKDGQIRPAQVKVSSSPSYTLAELSALSRKYIEEARQTWAEGDVVDTELQLSLFVAWLKQREKESM